ncbi:uncharacterized protein LOC143831256 [Paroedura picta]|uniref:uncharacterized protein LOC143831256 n=1 Tax=Paroedura picta TaxID=143630 RepID=UPI0040579670
MDGAANLQRQQQLEKQRATLRELSLRSQERHRNRAPLEDRVIEAQLEAQRFQKKSLFGQARPLSLWKERAPNWLKRFLCPEPEGIGSMEELPPRCSQGPDRWAACCLLWALAKGLFLLLVAMLLAQVLLGSLSACPGPRLPSAPLLYIQPQGSRPPLYS